MPRVSQTASPNTTGGYQDCGGKNCGGMRGVDAWEPAVGASRGIPTRRSHPRQARLDRSGSRLVPLILEDTMRVDLIEMLAQREHLNDRSSPPGDRLIKSQSCLSQAELPISAPYLVPEDHKPNCE